MAPQGLERIKSAPGNGASRPFPSSRAGEGPGSEGAGAQWRRFPERRMASGSEMAPQELEKVEFRGWNWRPDRGAAGASRPITSAGGRPLTRPGQPLKFARARTATQSSQGAGVMLAVPARPGPVPRAGSRIQTEKGICHERSGFHRVRHRKTGRGGARQGARRCSASI